MTNDSVYYYLPCEGGLDIERSVRLKEEEGVVDAAWLRELSQLTTGPFPVIIVSATVLLFSLDLLSSLISLFFSSVSVSLSSLDSLNLLSALISFETKVSVGVIEEVDK